MQSVLDLSLPHLALEDPEFAKAPLPRFKAAWEQHPWLATSIFGIVITQYTAIRDLLGRDEDLRVAHEGMVALMNAKGSKWERFQLELLLGLSGAEHDRIRNVLAPMFTPRAVNQHRGLMRTVIAQLLDEWAPKAEFDFEEFAAHFPISVFCGLIGASPDVVPRLQDLLETLGLSFNLLPELLPQLNEAIEVMEDYLAELIAERRTGKRLTPQPDMLDALLEAQDAGDLTSDEVYNLLIFLFVAGYDTSKNVLTLIMYEMLDRHGIYARCAEDVGYARKVVEETMRFHSVTTLPRLVSRDFVYRDILFPKDQMLFFPISMSGRDPSAFAEPDRFDPDRVVKDNRHMGFGRGIHLCLGQFIARAQIEEGLHLIAQRVTEPKLAGPFGYRPFPGIWGLRGLPIAFTPATAPEPSSAETQAVNA